VIGKSWCRFAAFAGSLICLSASAVTASKNVEIIVTHGSVTLTTSTYVNASSSTAPSGTPLLMAQAFRRGDVFLGSNCAVPRNAVTHNPLIWQHDNTATRRENGDDGSVRHWTFGVLTDAAVPPGGFYTIEWVTTGSACPSQAAHQSLSALAATHDLKVHFTNVANQDLTIRGSGSLTFDINAAALNAGRDAPTKYANGPVYDGWRIVGPPVWDAASNGRLIGAQLSPTQQALSNWTSITNGSFQITLDGGKPKNITGLNFSGAASLADVATAINSALKAAGVGATMAWNPVDEVRHFELVSNSTGPSSSFAFLSSAGSGTDISTRLLMTASSTSYNSSVNAYTAPGVAAGSADPLLYVTCFVDVTTKSDGTTMGKIRSVCRVDNSWLNVAAGSAGAGPGPAGYPNDPQTLYYRPQLIDGTVSLIDWGALFDASVTAASNPVFISGTTEGCSVTGNVGNCWKIPSSTGQVPWTRGGAHIYSCSPAGSCSPPHCQLNAAPSGTRTGTACQYSNGHLYFDFPVGTSGGRGLDSTYVSFSDVQGSSQGFSVDPTDQGIGTHNFSYRTAHTHWMSWHTLAPDTGEPWSDGATVSYSAWQPAFDQGPFNGERRYWEETGTITPISLDQTANVKYNFLASGNYYYQPMGRGNLEGGGAGGERPELDIMNQFAAACWVTMRASDCLHARNLSLSESIYPWGAWLNEATGRIPALNNGPPVGTGGGQGGSYRALGTANPAPSIFTLSRPDAAAGVTLPLAQAPIKNGGGAGSTDPMAVPSWYGAAWWMTAAAAAPTTNPSSPASAICFMAPRISST
jgi:Protein of unknown function (DUF3383)/Flagellin hook IN motif